jgi:hypothetical protein
MTVTEQLRSDITSAMKGGEKDRVGALRLVLSELQKAEKEGGDDELSVLRRERKRRRTPPRNFARRPSHGRAGKKLIAAYLPAGSEEGRMIAAAIADSWCPAPGHGPGDEGGDGCFGRPRRRARRVREAWGHSASGQAIVRHDRARQRGGRQLAKDWSLDADVPARQRAAPGTTPPSVGRRGGARAV